MLKSDENFDISEFKDIESTEDMQKAMEHARMASISQTKTNVAYRQRVLSLIQEADSRKLFEQYC